MNYIPLFIAGLTDSYNPCSIGVLLISLTILAGLGKRKLIVVFGFGYLTMIFVTYYLIGLGVLKAFHLFGTRGFFSYASGIILIILGVIHFLPAKIRNLPIIGWLDRCHIPLNIRKHLERGVFLAGIILGFLMGLCTIPCAGGIYLGTVALLASATTYWQGVIGLLVFNVGFILPLSLIFFFASRAKSLDVLKKANVKMADYGPHVISVIMIVMGIILLTIAKM